MTISFRNKLSAAAAVLALTAGAAATAPAAHAATPQCGSACLNPYDRLYGQADVLAVRGASGTSASQGQLIDLEPASNNPGEDWQIDETDTVTDLYDAGLVTQAIYDHYSEDNAYQFQYAPQGVRSGLCMGSSDNPADLEGAYVDLEPCGVNGQTLWVYDTADQYQRQIPLVNGTETNFSIPFVLTADNVNNFVTTNELSGGDGVIDQGQYWSSIYGPL